MPSLVENYSGFKWSAAVVITFELVTQISHCFANELLLSTDAGMGPRPRDGVDHALFQFFRHREQDIDRLSTRDAPTNSNVLTCSAHNTILDI